MSVQELVRQPVVVAGPDRVDGYHFADGTQDLLAINVAPADSLVQDVYAGVASGDLAATTVALAPEIDPVLSDQAIDFYTKIFSDPESDITDPHKPQFSPAAIELAARGIARWTPELKGLPSMTQLLAEMHLYGPARSVISISHGVMLETELANLDTPEATEAFVAGTLKKILGVRNVLMHLQSEMTADEAEARTRLEAARNQTAYAMVDDFLDDALPDRPYSAIGLQSELMGEVTTDDFVVMPDLNYRERSIGVETRNHSLYPTTSPLPARTVLAGRDGWPPHIEAVGENNAPWIEGDTGTLGFMRLADTHADGSVTLIERPCIMIPDGVREAMLASPDLYNGVTIMESMPIVHDMYHNVQPVFSRSFLLHQVDTPITLGGYLPAYERWGEGVRVASSDYEIGVARMHLDAFTKHLNSDPNLRRVLTEKIVTAYEAFEFALQGGVDPTIIRNVVETKSGKLFNMFQWDDEIYDVVAPYLERLLPEGIPVDAERLNVLITTEAPDFDTEAPFEEAWAQVMSRINEYPTATQAIFRSLEEIGVIDAHVQGTQLHGWQRIRWTAINAPADDELRGHMEKVHGIEGIHYGPDEVVPPLEVVRRQHAAIQEDAPIYEQRKSLLQDRQDVMVGVFNWLTRERPGGAERTATELTLDRLFVAVLDHNTADIREALASIPDQNTVQTEERFLIERCRDYLAVLSGYEDKHQVSIAEERDKILARKSTNPE